MKRTILHCDLNNFYASVECAKNPKLQGKAVAVCGNTDDRHGIVLAKSQLAKQQNVKTGDTIIEAKRKSPDLIIVHTDFDSYYEYSEKVKKIYKRYTDLIEPFGMDECWLDVSGSEKLFGNGKNIADRLRYEVFKETGLTISVGVSFNKVFAKLGSDMKKPNATTVISQENFKEKIWNLPAREMLFVGRNTSANLQKNGIKTIGDIALSTPNFMRRLLGKNGYDLWLYANGLDTSPVSHVDSKVIPQSVSRGITCVDSLKSINEALRVIAELSMQVSKALHQEHLLAKGVQIAIRNDNLVVQQYSSNLIIPTQNFQMIIQESEKLIKNYNWNINIRSITVRTYNLISEDAFCQIPLGLNMSAYEKQENVDYMVLDMRKRMGKDIIFSGCRLLGTKIPAGKSEHSSLPPAGYNSN